MTPTGPAPLRSIVACVAGGMLFNTFALGQTEELRFQRQLEQIRRQTRLQVNQELPPDQRVFVDYGAYVSANYLSLTDPELKNRTLFQYDLVTYGQINVDGVHEVLFRGRLSYKSFNEGDNFGDDTSGLDCELERFYYRFNLTRAITAYSDAEPQADVAIQFGRDLVTWGNGLTLSQTLDAVRFTAEFSALSVELLAGMTPQRTVDFDSSRPDFDDDTHRNFFGIMLSRRFGNHQPYAYLLIQRDHNGNDTLSIPLSETENLVTRFDYDSYYIGVGSRGALTDQLAYGVEFAWEGGRGLSDSLGFDDGGNPLQFDQTREEIRAWAFDLQLDYLCGDPGNTRLSFETVLASGDSDRQHTSNTLGGNLPGTYDRAFNAFGFLNTGVAFSPAISNIIIVRAGASTFPLHDADPFKRLQVGADVLAFAKLDRDAPIDEFTETGRYLGFEPNVYFNWQIASDITLSARYGVFFPCEAIADEADDEPRHFIYAGVTFAF
jgi:hypothetical protein